MIEQKIIQEKTEKVEMEVISGNLRVDSDLASKPVLEIKPSKPLWGVQKDKQLTNVPPPLANKTESFFALPNNQELPPPPKSSTILEKIISPQFIRKEVQK